MRRLAGFAQSQLPAFCLRDVRVCDRRPVRPRRHGDHQRPGTDAALPPIHSAVLVHPGVAGGGRVDYRDSRGRWLLPLGARRIRRLLGIPCRLVELERIVLAGRGVRGAFCGLRFGLPLRLFRSGGERDALRDRGCVNCAHWLPECARYPHGGCGGDGARSFCTGGRGCAVRRRCARVALQPVFTTGPSACAEISSFWRGTGSWLVVVLRVRATFKRC